MSEIDWIILGVLVFSCGVGLVRGMVREVVAIVGWVAGVMAAIAFAGDLALKIPLDSLGYLPRLLLAAIVIVRLTLFAIGLLGRLLRKRLEVAEIGLEDRALGGIFGFVRGLIIVCAGVFVFGSVDQVRSSVQWQQSVLVVPAEVLMDYRTPYLPEWFGQRRRGENWLAEWL